MVVFTTGHQVRMDFDMENYIKYKVSDSLDIERWSRVHLNIKIPSYEL